MARKLSYDKANKRTFMRENALRRGVCMWCKRNGTEHQLYKYWWEPDIGGDDRPDRFAMPFCSVECYRSYHHDIEIHKPKPTPQQEGLRESRLADAVHRTHGNRQWSKR